MDLEVGQTEVGVSGESLIGAVSILIHKLGYKLGRKSNDSSLVKQKQCYLLFYYKSIRVRNIDEKKHKKVEINLHIIMSV